MRGKKLKYFIVAAIFIVVAGLMAWKLACDFQTDVIKFSEQMTADKKVENGSVSIGSVYYEEGGSPQEVVAHVKPGAVYNGQIYVLNSKEVDATTELKVVPAEADKFDLKYFQFVDLKDTKVHLKPHEIKIVDFTITPPADYAEGMYFASISSTDQATMRVEQNGGSFDVMAAYAISLKVDVTNKSEEFKYLKLIDDPHALAMDNLLISLRKYVSLFLVALAIVFVAVAYKKPNK